MNIKTKILTVITLCFLSISVYAVELVECDSCGFSEMRYKASRLATSGYIALYNPTDRVAYKFRIFRTFEPGNITTNAFPKNFTQDELIFIDSLYNFLGTKTTASKSQTVNVDVSGITEFQGVNAYDIYYTSRDRNNLGSWINQNMADLRGGGGDLAGNAPGTSQMLDSMNKLLADALKANFNIDLSLDMIIIFSDGSQVVFTINVDDGAYPKHNESDSRNMDGNQNEIIDSADVVGNFEYVRNDQFQDIAQAAEAHNIPVVSAEGTRIVRTQWFQTSGGLWCYTASSGSTVCQLKR